MPQLRSPRIWGTFCASGGVGSTTLSLHLARVAADRGLHVLLIETDITAPLREILGGVPPFWEEYQAETTISSAAMPRSCAAGFSLLTRKTTSHIPLEVFVDVISVASEHFELIIIDNPISGMSEINSILVVENSLPSLIGLNTFTRTTTPEILIINKFSPLLKKKAAIEGFITDATTFRIPQSKDLQLALGFGINYKLIKRNRALLEEILNEMLP